jgi:activator of HSP90 ATPase
MMQYEWTLSTASSPPVASVFTLAKSRLPTALEVKFAEFANAIVDTHGKDLTVSGEPSRSGTPMGISAASASAPSTSVAAASVPTKKAEPKQSLDATTVSVKASFMADAAGLFNILTNEKEIRRWTHNSNDQVCFALCLYISKVDFHLQNSLLPKQGETFHCLAVTSKVPTYL